jgi:hypothetical protein
MINGVNLGYKDAMRRCLEECDVATARKLWAHVAPGMPQPRDDKEALIIIHHARTQSEVVTFPKRAYSHRWLTDNGLPSGLPDHLKPKAERMYPRIVDAVGIAVGATSEAHKPLVKLVRGAMENVVLDHYADGIKDPAIIKPRMLEARSAVIKKLLG